MTRFTKTPGSRDSYRRRAPAAPHAHDDALGRLILGLQPVREAVRVHGANITELLALRDNPRLDKLLEFAAGRGVVTIRRVSAGELDRLSGGSSHQGIAAYAPALRLTPWPRVVSGLDLLTIALDHVQDPQNFGAVIRSAVGLAGASVLWGENASAPLSTSTFRASAGAIEHAVLCRVASLTSALDEAIANSAQVIGLDAQAETMLSDIDLSGPTVIVLGAEDKGVSKAVRRRCTKLAKLPMLGPIASLNVSVAAALALYEAVGQRLKKKALLFSPLEPLV